MACQHDRALAPEQNVGEAGGRTAAGEEVHVRRNAFVEDVDDFARIDRPRLDREFRAIVEGVDEPFSLLGSAEAGELTERWQFVQRFTPARASLAGSIRGPAAGHHHVAWHRGGRSAIGIEVAVLGRIAFMLAPMAITQSASSNSRIAVRVLVLPETPT